ncbi:MAG: putative sulfate exporter family transporter [Nitrospirae bacterium]|nr:MAG: putative sulfate exporter family transporter [Nitrospirota bacterium]
MGRRNGFLTVLGIGGVSYGISFLSSVFDPLVLGITLGIIISNLVERGSEFEKGIRDAIRWFLPIGISLYGFQLRFEGGLSGNSVLAVYLVFIFTLIVGLVISKKIFSLSTNTSILIASGLSICGASAIAVISPAIGARREETSVSVLAVMTAGIVFTVIYPFLKDLGILTPWVYAFISGATLPMLGLVKSAASQIDVTTLTLALKFKYLRIASLVFMVAFGVLFSGMRRGFLKVPRFMLFFIIFVLIANLVQIPEGMITYLGRAATLFLTLTLTAIGLRADIGAVSEMGFRPFFSAIVTMTVTVCAILIVFLML